MITLIHNYPYDNNYDYIKTFTSKTEQDNYFNRFNSTTLTRTNYIKENEKTIKVPFSYDYLVSNGVNYVIYNNGFEDVYAFIIEKQYISEEVTRLIIEIDVIQTYMFKFSIKKSYVERKKCNIDEISDFDEGFNIGEHEISKVVTSMPKHYEYYALFNGFKNQELVFDEGKLVDVIEAPFATNRPLTIVDGIQYPLHFMPLKSEYLEPTFAKLNTSGVSGGIDEGSWEEGKISSKCFRFIKGMEGFAPRPYQDSGGYWTIAYGVTKHGEPDIYNQLVSQMPVHETVGAKISYELKNKNYASKIVNRCKELGITKQCQFDALTSLAYNCGYGDITGDNALTRAIKNDPTNETVIREIWENWKVTSNGIKLNGLIARRKEECNMFFNKDFEVRPIGLINTSGFVSGTLKDNKGNGWLP